MSLSICEAPFPKESLSYDSSELSRKEFVAKRAAGYKQKAKLLKATELKAEPTSERLNELFDYSLITGKLYRRLTINYNALKGELAHGSHNAGYCATSVDGKRYLVHRVIWCMVTGEWPEHTIDHEDTNRQNNAWINLRLATRAQNNRNGVGWGNSKSGVKGVYPAKALGRWEAKITLDSKSKSLGTYDSIEAAKEAYDTAAKQHYGEFARS